MAPTSAQLLAVLAALASSAKAAFPDCQNGPLKDNLVCNPHANYLDRAKAVVNEFTLQELINNSVNTSPGVPRLGLPPYNWWNEALHGVAASPGVTFAESGNFSSATSFPQPILMSAAFDDDLIHQVATVVSTEARAFNNGGRAGLDFWTPNINPFRDPRWGRGQETPGEDPYHTSRYVYQLVTGLQGGLGPDPFFKVVADCKHFAGYDLENWNGNSRLSFDARITTQDLAEFYTPSFQTCVRDAKVGSIMCSYNAVNGIPSCASEYFLKDIVRDYFGLGNDNWITSDCDAVENIYSPHNYTKTEAEASADALKAGTDIDCGTTYATSLGDAVNQTLVTQADIQQALYRQFSSLVRLGYFDPAKSQPYRQLGWADVNVQSAQQLAYTAAAESIVLLKNDGTLPLQANGTKTVAVVGPWANATTQMQGNYQGVAPFLISPVDAFQSAGYTVNFANGTGINSDDASGFGAALDAARGADLVVYAGGIDVTYEAESMDRMDIAWPGNQLQLIQQLAGVGKPFVVLQMGGGQVDSSSLKNDSRVNALIWGGYPGQSGGQALVDIITGKVAPAGRLPTTQYVADFVNQVPMTDMAVRPNATSGNPGRTYKWYTGAPVYEFGAGEHYTTFNASFVDSPKLYDIQMLVKNAQTQQHLDLGVLDVFKVSIQNTGEVASDYVALLFSNTTAGPSPAPLKQLVGYGRLSALKPGETQEKRLEVTLGSIARVDEQGNSVLYPGAYSLWLDTTGAARTSFTLTGESYTIASFPQPPPNQQP